MLLFLADNKNRMLTESCGQLKFIKKLSFDDTIPPTFQLTILLSPNPH